jgi:hypothetical protein
MISNHFAIPLFELATIGGENVLKGYKDLHGLFTASPIFRGMVKSFLNVSGN